MTDALIGYSGFVGSNLKSQHEFGALYNSKNIDQIKEKEFELVVCAAAPAAMWIANQKPDEDLANIESLIANLSTIKVKKLVLISTIAVYPTPIEVDEDSPIDSSQCLPYGKHRLLLEDRLRDNFDTLIVRLPGLFGAGLKKNIIYDFINNNNLGQIDSRAIYQFYNLDRLWSDITKAIANSLKLVNISVEPTSVAEVAKNCFDLEFENTPNPKPAFFDFRSKYGNLWNSSNGYLYQRDQALSEIRSFVNAQKASK